MSDAPQQAGPDLHAIFGMDERADAMSDPVVEVEQAVATGEDMTIDEDIALGEDVAPDNDIVIERADESEPAFEPEGEDARPAAALRDGERTGITRPSRRGSSSRFLTDVIVDMGLASRGQVDDAIESLAQRSAPHPSGPARPAARSPPTASRARSPSATASTISTSASSRSTCPPPT